FLLIFVPVLAALLFVLGRNHRVMLDRRERVLRCESRWFGVTWRGRAYPLRDIRLSEGLLPYTREKTDLTWVGAGVALLFMLLGPLDLILSFIAAPRSKRIIERGVHPALM